MHIIKIVSVTLIMDKIVNMDIYIIYFTRIYITCEADLDLKV